MKEKTKEYLSNNPEISKILKSFAGMMVILVVTVAIRVPDNSTTSLVIDLVGMLAFIVLAIYNFKKIKLGRAFKISNLVLVIVVGLLFISRIVLEVVLHKH